MQKARKSLYLQLRKAGLSSRHAGRAARNELAIPLQQCRAQIVNMRTVMGQTHFISLQLEELLAQVRINRREALRIALVAKSGTEPHPAQFPQRRGHDLICSFDDLAHHYGRWARRSLCHVHHLSRSLRAIQTRNGLSLIP